MKQPESASTLLPLLLLASTLAHLVVLLLPLARQAPQPAATEPPVLTVHRLARPPEVELADPPQPVPVAPASPHEPDSEPAQPRETTQSERPVLRVEQAEPVIDALELRAQALTIAGRAGEDEKPPSARPSFDFARVPALPSSPGWLNAHVGEVTAGSTYRLASDGSVHTRTVLSSGQVLCASRRPPTMDEVFNPWMSAAVLLFRDCGRERPPPPDATDPWQRR